MQCLEFYKYIYNYYCHEPTDERQRLFKGTAAEYAARKTANLLTHAKEAATLEKLLI